MLPPQVNDKAKATGGFVHPSTRQDGSMCSQALEHPSSHVDRIYLELHSWQVSLCHAPEPGCGDGREATFPHPTCQYIPPRSRLMCGPLPPTHLKWSSSRRVLVPWTPLLVHTPVPPPNLKTSPLRSLPSLQCRVSGCHAIAACNPPFLQSCLVICARATTAG